MQGKVHPYWFIPTTTFPNVFSIRLYQSDWGWYEQFETDNANVIIPNEFYSLNANDLVPIRFNQKVKQFKLIEKVYNNQMDLMYQRINQIKCYYPDDFNTVAILSPANNTLTLNDLDNLFFYSYAGKYPTIREDVFEHNGKMYIGRAYKHIWAWKLEINPHELAKYKKISNYDFVLVKYTQWYNGGSKAVISDRNYYPLGWCEHNQDYQVLLNKNENERLYIVRHDPNSYYGVGINEIKYLKVK